MNKTKSVLRILSIVFVVAALVFAGYMIRRAVIRPAQENNANRAPDVMLLTPKNVSYNDKTYTLTWEAVEHADSYKLDINGKKVDVEGTSYAYVPSQEVTSFKVQALETTGTYITSEWSDEVQYTVSKTEGLTRLAVNVYVGEIMGSLKLRNIVSITKIKDKAVAFSAVCSDGILYNVEYQYENDVVSLQSVIEHNDYTMIRTRGTYTAKDYDTAGSYLKSAEYVGTLEEYRTGGYEISVVSSQAYEKNNNEIGLIGVFKITNGIETKYLHIQLEFTLAATAREGARYTDGVEKIDPGRVYEVWCRELQGDFIDAMELYVDGFQKD